MVCYLQAKVLLPLVHALCKDKSWRVRYMAADKFVSLCNAGFYKEDSKGEEMVDAFVNLLQDNEPEVRTAAANKVAEVSKVFGSQITVNRLLPPCKTLATDSSQYTRGKAFACAA